MTSIFIFRRDFRLTDNIGLINALKNSETVIPIFILTPTQLKYNKYASSNAIQFMAESLKDLEKQLKEKGGKLYYFYGEPHLIIQKLIKEIDIKAVYVNMDYSPYSMKRDKEIEKVCKNIEFYSFEDLLLNPVSKDAYQKFTPYYNKIRKLKIAKPISNKYTNYYTKSISFTFNGNINKFYKHNANIFQNGGRTIAMKVLNSFSSKFKDYNTKRDFFNYNTTHLSPFIKFGCVSIREVFHKSNIAIRRQLYWRDFYYNILYAYPHVIGHNMKENYHIKWNNNSSWFNKWKNGETGFPIVDACMRQMNETGFMPNRGRMIVSNFLVKLLGIDWRKGEKYFASKLYDYDVANNNGGWQWSSSTGADSQPYFRIFNPWLQSVKFDNNGEYIKKWVKELRDVDAKDLHNPDKMREIYKPIIEYEERRKIGINMYKKGI